jgi:hypothetical protein
MWQYRTLVARSCPVFTTGPAFVRSSTMAKAGASCDVLLRYEHGYSSSIDERLAEGFNALLLGPLGGFLAFEAA